MSDLAAPSGNADNGATAAGDFDPRQVAENELAASMVPTPDDLLGDVGPLGQLFYVEQCCYAVLKAWAAMLAADAEGEPDATDERVEALQLIYTAAGTLDAACVKVSILPPEALSDAPQTSPA